MLSQQNIKISLKIKSILLAFILTILGIVSNSVHAQNQKFKVVLDAGHGGKDPGTLGKASFKNSYESHVALSVALKVGELLKADNNFKTIFTRKTNDFIPLHKRGSIANKADADLFISIHCNSAVTSAYGATTYVLGIGRSAKNLESSKRENAVILLEDDYEKHYDYDPNSEEFLIGLTLMQEDYQDKSIEFAQIVQNKFVSVAKRKNRGVNQGNFVVLYDSYMPSVLIEIGFLSNKIEEKFLQSKSGQLKIAKAIYEAIKTYKKRIDNNSIETTTIIEDSNLEEQIVIEEPDNNYYRIQIATSKRKIKTTANNFKKLKDIERIKFGSLYLYYYGKTTSLIQAKKLKNKAKKIGYKDAFIKRFTTPKKEIILPTVDVEPIKNTSNATHYYTVQFASSRNKISLKAYNFRGLENVFQKKVGKVYKYFYSKSLTIDEAKTIRKNVVKLGYKDAFVKKLKGKITTNKEVTKNTAKNTQIIKDIIFKVQISSGRKKIETKAYNFKGLKNVERVKIGNYYKYYYGKTNDYSKITNMHKKVLKQGYSDAKIVAIKNNKLVSVKSVINR